MASSSPLTVTGSAATIRAYAADWADFATWCQMIGLAPLPAAPATVAGDVAEMADPPDDRSAAAFATTNEKTPSDRSDRQGTLLPK